MGLARSCSIDPGAAAGPLALRNHLAVSLYAPLPMAVVLVCMEAIFPRPCQREKVRMDRFAVKSGLPARWPGARFEVDLKAHQNRPFAPSQPGAGLLPSWPNAVTHAGPQRTSTTGEQEWKQSTLSPRRRGCCNG